MSAHREVPMSLDTRHGNRARNRAGGREREPEAATDVSASREGFDDNKRPGPAGRPPGALPPGMVHPHAAGPDVLSGSVSQAPGSTGPDPH